jgi:hypothetical protein
MTTLTMKYFPQPSPLRFVPCIGNSQTSDHCDDAIAHVAGIRRLADFHLRRRLIAMRCIAATAHTSAGGSNTGSGVVEFSRVGRNMRVKLLSVPKMVTVPLSSAVIHHCDVLMILI